MIVEFEVSGPFQTRPGRYRSSRTIIRMWWGWFAVALYRGNAMQRTTGRWEES